MTQSLLFVLFLVLPSLSFARPPVSPEVGRFFGAVQAGNIEQARMALNFTNVNVQAPDGTCALHVAVQAKQTEMVRFLLDSGADHSLRNSFNMVPLHMTSKSNDVESARYLVEAGALVDEKGFTSRDGAANSTTLILAAELGSLELVQYLVEQGANINYVNNFERTALFWARKARKSRVVDYLVSKGATDDIAEAMRISALYEEEAKKKRAAAAKAAEEAARKAAEEAAKEAAAEAEAEAAAAKKRAATAGNGKDAAWGRGKRSATSGKGSHAAWGRGKRSSTAEKGSHAARGNAKKLTRKALRLRKKGEHEKALRYLQKAVTLEPDYVKAHVHLCLTYITLHSRDEAIKEYKVVKKLHPKMAKRLRRKLKKLKKSPK